MTPSDTSFSPPSMEAIKACKARIAPYVLETPVAVWPGAEAAALWGQETAVIAKLELLQRTGTFKPRGALNVMMHLSAEEKARGVTAVSAGNHAIAVSYAASILGLSAKVVMHKAANPFRVSQCRRFGAEVVLAEDISKAFDEVNRIREAEGRAFVHPFDGPYTVEGTATVGLELDSQAGALDAVIVPIGGGGLISGVAAAIKQRQPGCKVYGVEPDGAQGMTQSLAAGEPMAKVEVKTIADSLGAPLHMPHTFAIVQRLVDEVVQVDDQALIDAMGLSFREMKLAVEPAGAAAVAALAGPLRQRLAGKRVGLIVCGTNIDPASFCELVGRDS